MHRLILWLSEYWNALAVVVTVGVALLLVCCVECSHCPSRDKDDLFKHREP